MHHLILNISCIFWVIFILVVWYESDIIVTLNKLLKWCGMDFIRKLFKLQEYEKYIEEVDVMATYPDFIFTTYPNILTHLVGCNICLPVWLTLLHTCINFNLIWALIMFPINYCITLYIYLRIKTIL